jgi:hypothetical protein
MSVKRASGMAWPMLSASMCFRCCIQSRHRMQSKLQLNSINSSPVRRELHSSSRISLRTVKTSRTSFWSLRNQNRRTFNLQQPARHHGQYQHHQAQQPSTHSQIHIDYESYMPDPSIPPSVGRIVRTTVFALSIIGGTCSAAYYLSRQDNQTRNESKTSSRIFSMIKAELHKLDQLLPVPIGQIWDNMSDGQKVFTCIFIPNLIVFSIWRASMFRGGNISIIKFMDRHFTHKPFSGRNYTLLTSAFSHEVSILSAPMSCANCHEHNKG